MSLLAISSVSSVSLLPLLSLLSPSVSLPSTKSPASLASLVAQQRRPRGFWTICACVLNYHLRVVYSRTRWYEDDDNLGSNRCDFTLCFS